MSTLSKRKKIVLAAIAEFAINGFDKASMEAVALKAKVAKGTVFYHFKSKTELFEEIVVEGQKSLENKISLEIRDIKTNEEKIKTIIKIEVDFIKKYRNLFLVYLGYISRKPLSLKIINSVLSSGVKSGEFRKNLNVEISAMSLFWMTAMVSLNLKNIKTKLS